jgi:hypothetical protein
VIGTATELTIAPIPIVVGVTGHCDIHPEAIPDVKAAVERMLVVLRDRFKDALHIMTGLADGADKIVACTAGNLGIKTSPYCLLRMTIIKLLSPIRRNSLAAGCGQASHGIAASQICQRNWFQ